MRAQLIVSLALAFALPVSGLAQGRDVSYPSHAFNPAHADLPRCGGVPAQLANEDYVRGLARVVYYWAYPALDIFGRTEGMWPLMKNGPGIMNGTAPGGPVNTSSCMADYLPPAQRIIVTPNNDTFYGAAFLDLGREPVVIQTPADVPQGHYWTIQIADVFTNVVYQLGSASKTPGGKYLLVGPAWKGDKPEGFIGVLRLPTNYGGAFQRSFAARTPEAKARAIAVLDQMGAYPFSQNEAGMRKFDCEAITKNIVYPPGITEAMIAADPDAARPQWVVPSSFWGQLEKMLTANPQVGPGDVAMADQARVLIALRKSSLEWQALLDREALEADAALHQSARYDQVGVDAGNGWQRQNDGGLWGTDWFGRAQAAVVYILVNDYHEAVYFIRGTDAKGTLLDGKHIYTMTFPKGALPPVDRSRGGFWSLTMYDRDYFMLARSPNGRTNIGTVNLDAKELKFSQDGSLRIVLSHDEPSDPTDKANWLPAPEGQFALIVRAYVPTDAILRGDYKLPNVMRQ